MKSDVKSEAFTLIELLVVISIISLLMAILVPALRRVRGKAHQVWCMSILRNFSFAHKLYLHDTGKYLPDTTHPPHTPTDPPYTPWYNNGLFRRGLGLQPVSEKDRKRRLTPVLQLQEWKPNVPRKFICPAASYALDHPEEGLYPIDRSYGVNVDGDYWAWILGVSNYKDKEGWVKRPSDKLFMVDALDWWVAQRCSDRYFKHGENWIGHISRDNTTYGMTAYRHYDRANIMFWDGHCGELTSKEITVDSNDLWNPLK